MQKQPQEYTISVVIPTYNRKELVLKAIESAVTQTYKPLEILVIDDGSSDGTQELLEARTDIRYIKKQNGGVSSARNLGIREASGDWIAFLDSDDTWLSDKLQEQVQCLDETGCKANFTSISEDLNNLSKGCFEAVVSTHEEEVYYSNSKAYDFLWKSEDHTMVQTLLIQKELILNLGSFSQDLRVAEDTELFYKIILSGEFSYVNKVLAVLHRDREEHGLSDDLNPLVALERYRCYIQVQASLFWKVLPKSFPAAQHAISRVGYFSSRGAELECAFGNIKQCRSLAFFGIFFAKSLSNKTKSLALFFTPSFFENFYGKKWKIE